MPSTTTVNDLAERKRLLVLHAELHRQIIEIERFRMQQRLDVTRERFYANRWWLLGGLAAAGWLSTRRLGPLLKLLTSGMTAWRMAKNFRSR
ncbi:MAG: hypothetical protein ACREH8_04425 [Opitutaceae bacterium]